MMSMPSFTLDDYRTLIRNFRRAGYDIRKVSAMSDLSPGRVLFLRHDVDYHLYGVNAMAEMESNLGCCATYYVLLTSHYNVLYPENVQILRNLLGMGHEIGLHYDLECYPRDPEESLSRLKMEISILSDAIGRPVRTIGTHEPFKLPDPFLTLEGLFHPQDPRFQEGLFFVSDSCRVWRDDSLLRCFGSNPPNRVLMNTHPELWLDGSVHDRSDYLMKVVFSNATHQLRDFMEKRGPIWKRHRPDPREDQKPRKNQ
jgi:hypothetical protein